MWLSVFPFPVTFAFDTVSSKLPSQLLLTWIISPVSFTIVWFAVVGLAVGTAQPDGQMDGVVLGKAA